MQVPACTPHIPEDLETDLPPSPQASRTQKDRKEREKMFPGADSRFFDTQGHILHKLMADVRGSAPEQLTVSLSGADICRIDA